MLFGTPSDFEPELASRWMDNYSLLWRMYLYILDVLVFMTLDVCVMILWLLRFGCLLALGLHKDDFFTNFQNCVFLIMQLLRLVR